MIKKFTVSNFKSFKDPITLDFSKVKDYDFNKELIKNGLINKLLIYGDNSSGKSNLGFALMDITFHLSNNMVMNVENYNYYLNLDSVKANASFEYVFLFDNEEIIYRYEKNFERKLIKEEIIKNNKTLFYYDYLSNKCENEIEDFKNLNFTLRSENISALKFAMSNTFNISDDNPIKLIYNFVNGMLWFRSLRVNEFISNNFNNEKIDTFIISNNLEKDFEEFLNKAGINEEITSFSGSDGRKILGIKKKNFTVPFFQIASTGTISLTLFYYWLKAGFNGISFLFIDEFDAFYHTNLATSLVDMINKYSSFQSVLTTHDNSLLAANFVRPDAVMILRNNELKTLSESTNKILREGHNYRKLMEAGEFDEKDIVRS